MKRRVMDKYRGLMLGVMLFSAALTGCSADGKQEDLVEALQTAADETEYGDDIIAKQQVVGLDWTYDVQHHCLVFPNEALFVLIPENLGTVVSVVDDKAICSGSEWVNGTYVSKLVSYDYDIDAARSVTYYKSDKYFDHVGEYNGSIYVTIHDYDTQTYKTEVFAADTGLISKEEKEQAGRLDEATAGYVRLLSYNDARSYTQRLEEDGYILLQKEDSIYLYNGDSFTPVSLSEELFDFEGCDSKQLYYRVYDWTKPSEGGLYTYDIHTKEEKLICSKYSDAIGTFEGTFYWREVDDSEFGRNAYTICSYDTETGEVKKHYRVCDHPGMKGYPVGASGFKKAGDSFYFMYDDGNYIGLYTVKDGTNQIPLCVNGLTYFWEEHDWTRFGFVGAMSETITCPACGNATNKQYEEFFVLDTTEEIIPAAAQINQKLKENANRSMEAFRQSASEMSEYTYCEDHGTIFGTETNEMNVSSVHLIRGSYLAVQMDGYWYGGGAHGYPMECQYVYDINTGEELVFGDLYAGTEEAFKAIVAEKTVEDFRERLNSSEGSPYYTDEEAEIYNQAYEYASVTHSMHFAEDGMLYVYSPYEMGPFASGFIEVFISYEDLGIVF